MPEKFYLIDGHAHLYRAFYGVKGLTTRKGQPSNAVFGFTAMMRRLVNEYNPDYLAVAFDLPGPTFRNELYADYKANRTSPPDEFREQVPMTQEVLEAMDIPMLMLKGYEADDILGTLARIATDKGVDTVLVTSDKDANQLLSPHVQVLDIYKGEFMTAEKLFERDAITPDQVIDVMALSGDSSDNVPGIPKVGPKTAQKLILEHGTLEQVLACTDQIKTPKLRANLEEFADQARLSRELVTIKLDVPVEIDFDRCRYAPPDPERLAPVYEKLNFRQFLDDLDITVTEEDVDYKLINTPDLFDAFLKELKQQKRIAVDTETMSKFPRTAGLVGLSFSWKDLEGFYLPLRAPLGEKVLDTQATLDALRPILENPDVEKIGQNIKYDMIVLRNAGVDLQGIAFDTMIAAHVLDAGRRQYGLGELASDTLGIRMTPISDLIGKGKKQITMDLVALDDICPYACADTDIALRLSAIFEKRLKEQNLWEVYSTIELPLIRVLADMEYEGIGFDPQVLKTMSIWMADEIEKLTERIHEMAGKPFNVASPKQLAEILFTDMGLPAGKRTKTGHSTNSSVLTELAIEHELPGLVLEHRKLSKLTSTYVDALPRMANAKTRRIHTSFNQIGTVTGRLSSSDPNLQNIPIRTETGQRIREAFMPGKADNIFLSADYSQIELRILAHMTNDKAMMQAFRDDEDIHRFVASQVNNVALDDVTPKMRSAAKAVNFGIIYGLSPFGLSRDLRIPVDQAKAFIDQYFARYPGVKEFIDNTIAQAHADGYVRTLCGRRRPLPGLADNNGSIRQASERAAVNTVIQGTAADMIKIAMIRMDACLAESDLTAKMLLQIHDELLLELPASEEDALREMLITEMTGALDLSVPVKVNVAVGKNWMEAK
jgi:DNA polymerase I